jgi:Flp pilus assembly protein TadG
MPIAASSNASRRRRTLPIWVSVARARAIEESGQALVEFALVATVLLLIVFGITQFGLALNTANDETQLASEVARYASVNYNPAPSGTSLATWAKAQADTSMLASGGQICISFPNGTSNIGDPVKVVVKTTMNWQPLSALASLAHSSFSPSTTLSGSAVMRLEAQPSPSVYTSTSGCP